MHLGPKAAAIELPPPKDGREVAAPGDRCRSPTALVHNIRRRTLVYVGGCASVLATPCGGIVSVGGPTTGSSVCCLGVFRKGKRDRHECIRGRRRVRRPVLCTTDRDKGETQVAAQPLRGAVYAVDNQGEFPEKIVAIRRSVLAVTCIT